MNDPQIDFIMLIGNDIRISKESVLKQIDYLKEHPDVGMVGPVLLKKNSMIVENNGCDINQKEYSLILRDSGKLYEEISHDSVVVDVVAGGMNIAKRSFYENVGLQDEKLFMYSDEVDMGLRARKCGLKMCMVSDAFAWHQHINPQNTTLRHPYSAFLMARNKIYLAKKHGSKAKASLLFLKYFARDLLHSFKAILQLKREKIRWFRWHFIGAVYGMMGNMQKNKYSSL